MTNTNEGNKSEPFWLTDGLDDGDQMDMDIDSMLAQDFNFEDAADQSIDWAQWDAWLTEQNGALADDGAGIAKFE